MAARKTDEYIFADAYIGNFVARLMTRKDLLRVAAAREPEAAEAVLREFGREDAKTLHEEGLDAFLRAERDALYERVFRTVPDPAEFAFDLAPHDYHNVKVLLKAELLEKEPSEHALYRNASIPVDRLVRLIRERNYSFMPVPMKEGIQQALDTYARGSDPQLIDLILDRACFRQMLADSQALEDEFITGLLQKQIDAVNLRTFARSRKLGRTWSYFMNLFVEGGEVPQDILREAYEEAYPRVGERLEAYGWREAFTEGGRRLKEEGDFSALERLLDDAVMAYNRKAKYESFGPRPIQGFWYAAEKEIDNLRIALAGPMLGTPPEEIEGRLRETYV